MTEEQEQKVLMTIQELIDLMKIYDQRISELEQHRKRQVDCLSILVLSVQEIRLKLAQHLSLVLEERR